MASSITPGQKAGAAAAAIAALVAIAYGQLSAGPDVAQGHLVAGFDAGVGVPRVAVWATVRVDPAAQGPLGFDGGGRPVYARARICAPEVDGGVDPGPSLLPGMEIVYDDDATTTCAATDPTIEAWVQGWRGPDAGWLAPFACACSSGSACNWTQTYEDGGTSTGPAPTGATLAAGTWAGAGCYPKACVELAGTSSWPAECPP